jgi:FMN-dependent NADH-azoreductase
MKLLRIDSSARRDSVSRQLTSKFVALWQREHPTGEVSERDLTLEAFSPITDEWILASRVPPSRWNERERETLARSDLFIGELIAADVILIGTPMHNFTISWPLKAWIDQIVRVGKTVVYREHGAAGILQRKRVVVISSRGGSYRPGTPLAQKDFVEPYLRAILGWVGLTDITFIHVENQYRPDQAPAGKAAALQQIEQTIAELAADSPVELGQ